MTNKFIEQRVEVLEAEVKTLKLIVEQLRKPSTKVFTPTITINSVEDKPKTANELRAEIIEKAKGFVEGLTKHISQWNYKNETEYGVIDSEVGRWVFNTEFVVNNEKLTIVALLRGSGSGSVYSRGIAKCMPSDVFNSHIGKAIALGRALGLDVSEFEQAVQPSETAEGMLIDTGSHVLEATDKRYVFGKTCHINSNYGQKGKIINDTNAIYGGVE